MESLIRLGHTKFTWKLYEILIRQRQPQVSVVLQLTHFLPYFCKLTVSKERRARREVSVLR